MHAVVVTANIDAAQVDGARKHLREVVVPRVKTAPGLVKAYWSLRADSANGISFIVFDSKEHAEGAADMVRSAPPPPGVTLGSVEVREVVAEA
jgi:hypothetical protein